MCITEFPITGFTPDPDAPEKTASAVGIDHRGIESASVRTISALTSPGLPLLVRAQAASLTPATSTPVGQSRYRSSWDMKPAIHSCFFSAWHRDASDEMSPGLH